MAMAQSNDRQMKDTMCDKQIVNRIISASNHAQQEDTEGDRSGDQYNFKNGLFSAVIVSKMNFNCVT